MLLLVPLLAAAQAQPVSVTSPPDRFVAPGEFVTLVFELESPEDVDVLLEVSSSSDWFVVRPPATLRLEADVVAQVEVAVEVPPGALAFSVDRVTLRIDAIEPPLERVVELSVTEVVDVELQAPLEAAITDEGLLATVINVGNIAETGTLELQRDGEVLDRRSFDLAAGEQRSSGFALSEEGPHTLLLTSERGIEVERSVRVFRFGTPAPEPFRLGAQLAAGIDLEGAWDASLTVRGEISDFSSLDLRVNTPTWRSSYAQVTLDRGTVRVGAAGPAPFRLDLPRDLGVSVIYQDDAVGVASTMGASPRDELATNLAASWTASDASLAVGFGLRDGAPLAALRAGYTADGLTLALSGRYRDESLNADLRADIRAAGSLTTLRTQARDVLRPRSRLEFSARHRSGPTTVYGDLTLPMGESASWSGRAGTIEELTTRLPGSLRLELQAGSRDSFARLTHAVPFADGWRTSNAFGVRLDTKGFGFTLDSAWTWRGAGSFSLDSLFTYYPTPELLEGRVRTRFQIAADPLSLAFTGTWNLTNDNLSAAATFGWGEGPWDAGIEASVRYAYGSASQPWTTSVDFFASYTFDITVPAVMVDAAGGRRLGTLNGTVLVEGEPVPGVVVAVGPYRAQTDERGHFLLNLAPGTYDVRLDLRTIPSGLRPLDRVETHVAISARTTSDVAFRLERVAVVGELMLDDVVVQAPGGVTWARP